MQHQHVFDFLGIDVHAAGDDHIRASICEVDVALVIDESHVADREDPRLQIRRGGLLGILVILEGPVGNAAPAIEIADLSRRQAHPVVPDRKHFEGRQRAANGPGMGEPILAIDQRIHTAFGPAPILKQYGAPPFDHLMLDRR